MTTSKISGSDILEKARAATDNAAVGRVFGTPVEKDGVLILPVAVVGGGGGGGAGSGTGNAKKAKGAASPDGSGAPGEQEGEGSGGGFGYSAKPAGVFVLKNGDVSWRPAVDVNRIVMGGQIIAVIALLVAGSVLRRRRRR